MDVVRRVSLLATAALLGLAILLGSMPARPALSASAAASMQTATRYLDSTIVLARNARPRGARGDALTIGLGYLERERLGFGSPFRLVDDALHDPRMDPWMSSRVTWGLLARLRRGDVYVVDAAALEGIGPWSADGHGATGEAHLALIEHTIAAANDPREGELAVRLAYTIAAAKGALAPSAVTVASQTAALVRDRLLAEEDLRDLLAAANERHVSVMALLGDWRAARAFRVEQPALVPLTSEQRTAAMDAVPALVRALDTLDHSRAAQAQTRAVAPLIGPRFAERLALLADEQPPLAQLLVPLRSVDTSLAANNAERLAAALVRRSGAADSSARQFARAQLAGAVALRTSNQDTPWFAGDGGPSASDLTSEFGLANVSFARTVPSAWRPYYLGELQRSLRDLAEIFPAVSFSGLSVSFGSAPLPDSALAMHEPRTRTVRLTIATSGGTLAHELAHDLDWQTSQRLFANAGGYSTDRAVSQQRGALASSVRGLGEARTMRAAGIGGGTRANTALGDRPAELFARGADWFVASALARGGKSNGFLTAVQDASLTGYAAGTPTAVGVAGTTSLTSALDQMTFVPDTLRAAFDALWSDASTIDPLVLVRHVLATPVSYRIAFAKPIGLPAPRGLLCTADHSAESRARHALMMLAIDARAHGIAMRRARYRHATAGPRDRAAGEQLEVNLRVAIERAVRDAPGNQGIVPAVPAPFTGCW